MILRTAFWKQTILTTSLRHLKNIKRTCQMQISGMELGEIVRRLQNYAPLSLAESWDNVGLLVEPSATSHLVSSILMTNDLTEAVMDEAIEKKRNMILSYHPPIFHPLKRLTRKSWKERVVLKAIENKIAIYSPHTAFDAVKGGVNDWLASGLGKGIVTPLQNAFVDGSSGTHKVNVLVSKDHENSFVDELVTKLEQADDKIDVSVKEHLKGFDVNFKCNAHSLVKVMQVLDSKFAEVLKKTDIFSLAEVPLQDTGVGRVCTLEEPASVETMIKRIKDHLKLDNVSFAQAKPPSMTQQGDRRSERSEYQNSLVKTIAICAGSGGSVLKGIKADMYLTGEMSHHDVLDAVSNGVHVVLGEHSNTERGFFKDVFSRILYDMLEHKVTIEHSTVDVDPITIV